MKILRKLVVVAMALFVLPSVFAGHIVFNEVMVNPDGADGGKEYIELYNKGDMPVDVSGWQIGFKSSSSMSTKVLPDSLVIPGNGVLLITNNPADAWPAEWTLPDARLSYSSLTNSGMGLQLIDTSLEVHDRLGWGAAESIVGYYEAMPVPDSGSGVSLQRIGGDCTVQDTNNNVVDVMFAAPTPGVIELPGCGDAGQDATPQPTETHAVPEFSTIGAALVLVGVALFIGYKGSK